MSQVGTMDEAEDGRTERHEARPGKSAKTGDGVGHGSDDGHGPSTIRAAHLTRSGPGAGAGIETKTGHGAMDCGVEISFKCIFEL